MAVHVKNMKSVGSAVVLSMLSAVFLVAVGQSFARPVLLLLETPQEILGYSLLYLRIIFL